MGDISIANKFAKYFTRVFVEKTTITVFTPGKNLANFEYKVHDVQRLKNRKSVGPDGIPGEILKLGEAMIMYVNRLLEIVMNNSGVPDNWRNANVAPIHKSGSK